MDLFDTVRDFLQGATPAGWLGIYDGLDPINYGAFYDQQAALYQQELNRRNKQFEANEIAKSNAVTTNLLTGGNKPVSQGSAAGVDFKALQDEFVKMYSGTDFMTAYQNTNLAGLSGDQLEMQKRANAQIVKDAEDKIKESTFGAGLNGFEIGV